MLTFLVGKKYVGLGKAQYKTFNNTNRRGLALATQHLKTSLKQFNASTVKRLNVIRSALSVVICSALLVFYFVKHFAPARHSSNEFGSALA